MHALCVRNFHEIDKAEIQNLRKGREKRQRPRVADERDAVKPGETEEGVGIVQISIDSAVAELAVDPRDTVGWAVLIEKVPEEPTELRYRKGGVSIFDACVRV